ATMRENILALIEGYNISPEDYKSLYVLEMIAAGREMIARSHRGDGEVFEKQAFTLVRNIEIEAAGRGELIEGVETMLIRLRERGIKTGIVTRNCLDAVQTIFPDVHDYCSAVITREFTERVKPHPDHIKVALSALEALPGCSAMVGDHPMDMTVGKEVGTFNVGVLTGYSEEAPLYDAGADIVIDSAATLPDHIV
ncbi:MAG: HAD family hydrolase, partial [Deltaproteobacteria bacterium]|nr:HAD family hydrolase [Deltaproteobacteria bacterium]